MMASEGRNTSEWLDGVKALFYVEGEAGN